MCNSNPTSTFPFSPPHLKAPSFSFHSPPSPPAPGNLLKAQLSPLLFSWGAAHESQLLRTGHGSWKHLGVAFLRQALLPAGSQRSGCCCPILSTQRNPQEEWDGNSSPRSSEICLGATGSELLGRFLRASQVSHWVQTTASNVVVGDKPSNAWGARQSLHPARNHLTKSWCANGLGPIIFD